LTMTPVKAAALFAMPLVAIMGLQVCSALEPANLDGSWTGHGHVRFPSGATENAQCSASFKRYGSMSFEIEAHCATASGKVDQTAIVKQVADKKFTGNFKNTDFGITGSIDIIVDGTTLQAALAGDNGARAEFRLTR
jgi:hypothetical protein